MRVTRIIDRVVRDTDRARDLVVPVVLTAATIVAVAITSVFYQAL